jgi:heme oxygenase (biliverdin-IX-beta and delta-forming)
MLDNGGMDLERLRAETRAEHESTESVMPLMQQELSREQYVAVLQRLHPVVGSWERWALAHAPADLTETVNGRQRAGLIARDLKSMGAMAFDEAREFPAAAIPGLMTDAASYRASFLGAMYVMEGSTLGGQYIARHLEEVLGLQAGEGDAYFRGYGEHTGEMWRSFKAVLADVPDTDTDSVIAAAKAMFGVFRAGMTE